MSLEVRYIDHQTLGTAWLLRQDDEDSAKDTTAAPPDKTII
ncbi:hypothetical protein SXCC_03491 [Gluconacetobacter sp. SXCC-1]|nr:hypothetical protein SXCC_03491 [Gluconacetobacter sp. SXCC-1]